MAKSTQQENRGTDIFVMKFDAHKVPAFKEMKDKDWIIYGADDREFYNRYPNYLLQLYNRSGKNNALINGIAHYVAGNGIEVDYTGLSIIRQSELADMLKQANKYGETASEIMYKATLDKKIFGGFCIEVIWNKVGSDFEYYHMDFCKIRKDKNSDGFWYSENWEKRNQDEKSVEEGGTGLKYIPAFTDEKGKRKGNQLYYVVDYRPGLKWYPLPDYIGAVPYAEIDYEISNFWLNGIKSGFNAGTIINFNNGKPTPEAKSQIEKSLKEKFTGTDRANSLLINFAANKENAATVEHLNPSDFDKTYNLMNEAVQNELYTGHRITNPILFGVKTPGQLGGKDELIESYELFKSTYIQPFQKIMNDEFNYLLSVKGFDGRIRLKEAKPIAVDYLTEDVIKTVLTRKELRTMAQKTFPDIIKNVDDADPLLPEPVKPITSSAVHRFVDIENLSKEEFAKKQKDAVAVFRKYGTKRDGFEFISMKPLYFGQNEEETMYQQFDDIGDLKDFYKNILTVISENPLADNAEIAKALDTSEKRVQKAVDTMTKDGIIEASEKKSIDGKIEKKVISDKAAEYLDKADIGTLSIMYSYEPRPGLSIKTPSRQFCQDVIAENLLFTREDIERVSLEIKWDVWKYRGGFWRHKKSDITTPYCRHLWVQNVVRRK